MQYMGSKRRIKKYILPIILRDRSANQTFVDLFCGGCNLIDEVTNPRIANDLNEYVIALWKALQNGWQPPAEVTEQTYNCAKIYRELLYAKAEIGFIGFCCSFGAKWFAGYGRRNVKRYGGNKTLCAENRTTLLKQILLLESVKFTSLSYKEVYIPENSIVYCDPPYKGTTQYKNKNFDHAEFWDYCRYLVSLEHKVFISEYEAPKDFICVYVKNLSTNMQANKISKSVERLFIHESQLDI